ncbi:MAG: sulfatase-like hydrolase/transferase [Akkermansiaceae bacterium]|nr:sulfatase-like hydrolase/transferase [Akkermansiaceae bacterium]
MAGLLAVVGAWPAMAAEEERPNVILIMADDLGYGDLSCYRGTAPGADRDARGESGTIRTPVLDRLAAGGVRLTSFYAGATVCTPSRMALLTGAYPPRLGWRGGVLGYKMKTSTGLAPEARTIAEVFKGAGYRTGLCGKWHLGSTEELGPRSQGFDAAFFIKMSNNQTKKLWRDGELVADPFDNRRLTEQFTEAAIAFIKAGGERPFFLYLPFTAPHFPAEPHPEWKGRSRNGAYGDVVEELDARIGEILESLRETGLEKKTIVVFLSDNGPEPGQKKFATAAPHRGLKWSSLEGGTRVPCIVSWPGVVPTGRVSDEITAAVDLLPTLARACGIGTNDVEGRPPLDGRDVWDTLAGREGPHPRQDLLYWSGWAVPQAIRVGRWKLYFDEVKDVPGSDAGPALFDLAADPSEEKNRAADHPDKVTAMMDRARKQLAEIEANAMALGGPPADGPQPKAPRWLR